MTIKLFLFIAIMCNGEAVGTTDFNVYKQGEILTIEVL